METQEVQGAAINLVLLKVQARQEAILQEVVLHQEAILLAVLQVVPPVVLPEVHREAAHHSQGEAAHQAQEAATQVREAVAQEAAATVQAQAEDSF